MKVLVTGGFAYADKGLPVVIARYFDSYGPRPNLHSYSSVVARFIVQAFQGKQWIYANSIPANPSLSDQGGEPR